MLMRGVLFFRACPTALAGRALLFFREQIQGPENASIARFHGLCCYQSDSEIPWSRAAGAFQPFLRCSLAFWAAWRSALSMRVLMRLRLKEDRWSINSVPSR